MIFIIFSQIIWFVYRFFAAQSGKGPKGPGSSGSAGSCTGGPVYKFKSALLSRESRTSSTDSRTSSGAGSTTGGFSKVVPIAFDRGNGAFGEACDRFIEDLSTKSVSVSRRPSMDAYRDELISQFYLICNQI